MTRARVVTLHNCAEFLAWQDEHGGGEPIFPALRTASDCWVQEMKGKTLEQQHTAYLQLQQKLQGQKQDKQVGLAAVWAARLTSGDRAAHNRVAHT